MKFIRTNIPDVVIIEPQVHGDDRGISFSDKDKIQPLLKDTNDIFKYGVDYYND